MIAAQLTTKYRIICGDCLEVLATLPRVACIFADPPDNIGLKYNGHDDRLSVQEYTSLLQSWLFVFVEKADTIWFSHNARWVFQVGRIVCDLLRQFPGLEAKLCVQVFTFGQHNHHDLASCYRPLLRLRHPKAPLFADAIRVRSWRQENGDKRADPRGRVPGDVFDFPRVVGNSKQRRPWHPTQLNEGLVERCLKLSTAPGDMVLDPFAGTGTTLRVCKRIERGCIVIDKDATYCHSIGQEHDDAQCEQFA